MKVVLDARPLQSASAGRGIGRYVRELARHLPAVEDIDEVLLLLDSRQGEPDRLPAADGLRPLVLERPPGPAIVMDRLKAVPEVAASGADVFHATYLPPPRLPDTVATVMTLHDLIPLQIPKAVPPKAAMVFRMAFAWASSADRIVTVSRATADAVRSRLAIPEERIVVTHLGVDAALFDVTGPAPFDGAYLLHVGGFDPAKNQGLLLDVMERLAGVPACSGLRLVLVGEGGARGEKLAADAARRGLGDRVLLPGRLDDDALGRAYAGAQLFLFPSLAEGFGLPALEAQAAGCPVLAADAASLPEVVGDAGRLLAPDDAGAWAAAVRELVEHPEARRALSDAGRARARRFTWAATAEATARAYRAAREHR